MAHRLMMRMAKRWYKHHKEWIEKTVGEIEHVYKRVHHLTKYVVAVYGLTLIFLFMLMMM